MKTKIKCPCCEEVYSVDKSLIGELVKCENCGTTFTASRITNISLPQKDSSKPQKTVSPQNAGENPSSEINNTNGIEKWINDFFNFKIMITPELIKAEFYLLLFCGSVSALVYPFQLEDRSIMWRIMLCVLLVFLGIPVLALTLHTIYEFTMIPFVILETLLEIRNKLDEKQGAERNK